MGTEKKRTLAVENEVVCEELHETSVEEDTGGEGVEHTRYDESVGRIGVVGRADAEADGKSERSDGGVEAGGGVWDCAIEGGGGCVVSEARRGEREASTTYPS
jgi:hypothetical protein